MKILPIKRTGTLKKSVESHCCGRGYLSGARAGIRKGGSCLAFLLLLGAGGNVRAQTGGIYDLSWASVDSGGIISEGGAYKLAGVIGQPEITPVKATGGTFDLLSGFLQDATYFPVPVTLTSFELE